jgi:PhnB protein
MPVQPYLFFDGRCEEAIEFYRKTLGAEVTMLMRFKDSPEAHRPGMVPPGAEDKVMHAVDRSDGACPAEETFAETVTASRHGSHRSRSAGTR